MLISRPSFAKQRPCDPHNSLHLVDSGVSGPELLLGPASAAEKVELPSALPSLDPRYKCGEKKEGLGTRWAGL